MQMLRITLNVVVSNCKVTYLVFRLLHISYSHAHAHVRHGRFCLCHESTYASVTRAPGAELVHAHFRNACAGNSGVKSARAKRADMSKYVRCQRVHASARVHTHTHTHTHARTRDNLSSP